MRGMLIFENFGLMALRIAIDVNERRLSSPFFPQWANIGTLGRSQTKPDRSLPGIAKKELIVNVAL